MGNLMMLLGVRVESIPGAVRELVVTRPGFSWEWRAELPALLDQRPAPAVLVEYLVRLFQRQRPTEAASAGLIGLGRGGADGPGAGEWRSRGLGMGAGSGMR